MKITLIGESCHDHYHIGRVNRISPEAPIPILDFSSKFVTMGMATNVYENFTKLGVGGSLHTTHNEIKTRYIDDRSGQQLLREDVMLGPITPLSLEEVDLDCDALVISDYNKGFVTYKLIKQLRNEYDGPIYIDTKKPDLKQFHGCTVKINEYEYEAAASLTQDMIVTYGGRKVTYQRETYTPPKVDLIDACGCGDTFLAAFVYKHVQVGHPAASIEFAMAAAACTVKRLGVYAPTLDDIEEMYQSSL
jgi:bifunctional ADP-heptose synthase (sugar kinase/adenylyltransferase)